MQLEFSFIVPVFNRPEEIKELLYSFSKLKTQLNFEIVIIEDGSTVTSKDIVDLFIEQLNIVYFFKNNTGPGDSRNYGMSRAKGNYFIILDSDCILPENYLTIVNDSLAEDFVDCYGGPDTAHESFSNLQKAINFTMTSIITTGGIRGLKTRVNNFQPRSFNMGISKSAFISSKGFGNIHPGEDPDLAIRLQKLGFKTKLISDAYVFHKRRISWTKFYNQMNKFGLVRPILNKWHPKTRRITYWFPSLFILGVILGVLCFVFNIKWILMLYVLYFLMVFILALFSSKSLSVAFLSLIAISCQFTGYGLGFLKSTIALNLFNKNEKAYFPELFFKSE